VQQSTIVVLRFGYREGDGLEELLHRRRRLPVDLPWHGWPADTTGIDVQHHQMLCHNCSRNSTCLAGALGHAIELADCHFDVATGPHAVGMGII